MWGDDTIAYGRTVPTIIRGCRKLGQKIVQTIYYMMYIIIYYY